MASGRKVNVRWPFRASSRSPGTKADEILPPEPTDGANRFADFTLTAPVDVEALAAALGLQWAALDLPDQQAGSVASTGGGWLIAINSRHDRLRRRLATAHGIARFVLQGHLFDGELALDAQFRSSLGEDLDREADAFAASILIPPALLRRLQTLPGRAAAELAKAFAVPIELAESVSRAGQKRQDERSAEPT